MAENDFGFPAIALVLLYRNHRSKALQQEFEDLLPLSNFYEEYEFFHLYKVVLGVRPLDLKVRLDRDVSRSQLNQKDKMGLTPLYWAASQGNTFAVRLLLQAGADINIVDNGGNTPLHMACRAGSRTCAEALTIAGADIHKRLPNGYQCIHLAAMAMHGIDLLECILSHRAPISDSQNSWNVTPLALATLYSRADNCKYLLEYGVGVDNLDWEGNMPIFGAIRRTSSTKFLSLFLGKNCDYLRKNFEGQAILHVLALYGTLEKVELLASTSLKGLKPYARDSHSRTAQQYLDARVDLSEKHKETFEKLLWGIEAASATAAADFRCESDEDDVFVDALEGWVVDNYG
jgi:ankyrin repeat protein